MSEARASGWASVLAVARGELRRLLRDRKAIVLAVLLPVLSYPLLIWGSQRFGELGQEQLQDRAVSVAVDLDALPDEVAGAVRARLADVAGNTLFEERALGSWTAEFAREGDVDGAAAERAREALGETYAALLAAAEPLAPVADGADADGTDAPATLVLVFDGADDDGIAAATQLGDPLEELAAELEGRAFEAELGADPARAYALEQRDVARAEDTRGLALGRMLPLVAVLVLLSGGAFAALDAFAGEREQGTLETLLVQPLPTWAFAWGKFLVVLATSLAAWVGNVAGLLWSVESGWFELPGAEGALGGGSLGAPRILLAAVVFLPTVVLLAAALCYLAARARTFREGQHYLLPATLIATALAAPAMAADVRLDLVLAWVPLTGPSLALRDALAGELAWAPALVALASSLGYAAFALSRLATTLDAERLLAAPAPKGTDPANQSATRAVRYGLAAVALVYVAGGWLQSKDLVWGLVATLWGLAVGIALLLAATNARARRTSVAEELALAPPRALPSRPSAASIAFATLAALAAGPGLAWLARLAIEGQQRVLPLPPGQGGELEAALLAQPLALLLFLIALSPAICEELLFRGAILRGLLARPRSPAWRAVALQAALFALVHASIHRLPLTFALGLLLGLVTLRARVLWPAMALHASYNASQLLSALHPELRLDSAWWALGVAPLVAWATLHRTTPR